jgi:hypothetical protein
MGILTIAHQTQADNPYTNDCLPACGAMIADLYCPSINATVGMLYTLMAASGGFNSIGTGVRGLDRAGVPSTYAIVATLAWHRQMLEARTPTIALIDYRQLAQTTPPTMTKPYLWAHFIVVAGFAGDGVYVHDPLWRAGRWLTVREFDAAISTPSPYPNALGQIGGYNAAHQAIYPLQPYTERMALRRSIRSSVRMMRGYAWPI